MQPYFFNHEFQSIENSVTKSYKEILGKLHFYLTNWCGPQGGGEGGKGQQNGFFNMTISYSKL